MLDAHNTVCEYLTTQKTSLYFLELGKRIKRLNLDMGRSGLVFKSIYDCFDVSVIIKSIILKSG